MKFNSAGNLVDIIRCSFKTLHPDFGVNTNMISTDYGKIRVLDTNSNKPVIINVPDGPNVIEHHENLIAKLSENFRVICFELPGIGFSYPNSRYDYSTEKAAKIIINLLDILKIERATAAFSCSNGFYAIKAASLFPQRISQLFLSQTPSLHSMEPWVETNIPKLLRYPIIGQLTNSFAEKKLAKIWYKNALPKSTNREEYEAKALNSLDRDGCFCLSGLVQGLTCEIDSVLKVSNIPATIVWGNKDYSHRKTDHKTIVEHLPDCEIIEFDNCGHFPELEDTDRFVKLLNERFIGS
jgi:pimeloyl-ACP methyl ester carboxylesterase